jgi:hypothetical protein
MFLDVDLVERNVKGIVLFDFVAIVQTSQKQDEEIVALYVEDVVFSVVK